MHFLSPSLSVATLTFFIAATRASQAGCLETWIRSGTTRVVDLCKVTETPTDASATPALQTTCLTTITKNGMRTVLNTCTDVTPSATDSEITTEPPFTPPVTQICETTLFDKQGKAHVVLCGNEHLTGAPTTTSPPAAQTPIAREKLNTACLTTMTKHDGQVVVVNCGNGFASGHPPTTTTLAPASTPTTICIKDRCFEVIGTFGSATSTPAAPTQSHFQDEL